MPTPRERDPHARSWLDRLIAAISRLPGPPWIFYLTVTVLFILAHAILTRLDGSAGTIATGNVLLDFITLHLNDLFTVYGLAFVHFLTVTARRALEEFRPALGALEASHDRLERELTTTPWLAALVPAIVAVAFTAASIANSPSAWAMTSETSLATDIFVGVQGAIFVGFFFIFVTFALRQVIVVVRIHRQATAVSLYAQESNSAFSRLTLRTSIGLVLPAYVFAFVAIATGWSLDYVSVFEIGAFVAVVLASAALFVLPLYGMRRRLVREKTRLITAINLLLESAAVDAHTLLANKKFETMGGLSQAMSTLLVEKATVSRLSTWPWQAETLRGFFSSIALPVVLWLITTLLGRFLS